MNLYRFGFLGAGNIAGAILSGICTVGDITPDRILVYDVDAEKTSARVRQFGVGSAPSARALAEACDFIFLTVKPQVYSAVLHEIAPAVDGSKCLVDVGAGVTIDFVKSCVGRECAVVRAMPNTPLLLCQGATALVHAAPVTDAQFAQVQSIFSACGVTRVVAEEQINAVTAVSGSSPAFVFRFARALISRGVELGLAEADAKALAVQTIAGSAAMIRDSGMEPDELIRMVASPNGTTEAGLRALDETGFDESVRAAVTAANDRAEELSAQR